MSDLGKLFIALGIVPIALGAALVLAGRIPGLGRPALRIATLVLVLALGAPLMGEGAQTIRVAIVEQARTV